VAAGRVRAARYNRPRMTVATPAKLTRDAGTEAAAVRPAIAWHALLLPVAIVATLALQLSTLTYYFYFDDYVPFSEIVVNGQRDYIWRLVTATDLTPNWRPLPGLLYLASYDIAGMNPLLVHIVMLAMHAGSVALLYYLIWRVSGRAWAACLGALAFGLNPAYVGALSQVTTATQIMAVFFLLVTLIAVIECALADDRRVANAWLAAGVVSFVLVLGSHEGMAIMFPVFGLAFLTFDRQRRGRLLRAVLRTAPFAVLGWATAVSFWACGCNEGTKVWGTDHVWNQTQIYAGRLFYPVGLELPNTVNLPHMIGAAALAAIMILVSAFGPKIARVGALWIVLAIAPHVFIQYFTASRYLYLAAPGFAIVFASAMLMLVDAVPARHVRTLALVGAPLLAALFGWYAYETVHQERQFAGATADWRQFHRDVTRVFPSVPPGTRVMVIGGPFQKWEYQYHILPAFAETTWGDGVTLGDYEPGSLPAQLALVSRSPYVAEYRDGRLVQLYGAAAGE
jgi:hypothetical protein